jgi:hypothetical protein
VEKGEKEKKNISFLSFFLVSFYKKRRENTYKNRFSAKIAKGLFCTKSIFDTQRVHFALFLVFFYKKRPKRKKEKRYSFFPFLLFPQENSNKK